MMEISFTVQSVAVVRDFIQLRLTNNGLKSRPDQVKIRPSQIQPLVSGMPKHVGQMVMQIKNGILQQVGAPAAPTSVIILSQQQYDEMGRPTVKDVLRADVAKEG